ncbi:DUF3617 domain-containing protein [Dyella sp. Tek66A03]|uniref:DUF3617 domain-containing protein n=1 Tax=Dyella sp. Tek66A03 TaxID=3458298 RepID=UPI00403EB0DA
MKQYLNRLVLSWRQWNAMERMVALASLAVLSLAAAASHADPGDFQAMPGLWKITTRSFDHGHAGSEQTRWHCVDEGPDPWLEFADLPGPVQCKRSGELRRSTALAWTLTCPGMSPAAAHGRVDFDSPEHYTASVKLQGHDVVQVEGRRYAACTSAND